jgi:hypothetical protein
VSKLNNVITLLLIVLLSGCSTASFYKTTGDETTSTQSTINSMVKAQGYEKVITMERPPVQIQEYESEPVPTWLDENVKITANGFPLSLIITQIVGDDAKVVYGYGVNPSLPISIHFNGTKEDALNLVQVFANYGFKVSPTKIVVDEFISKTFALPSVSGTNAYQIGSASGGSDADAEEASAGEVSSTSSDDGQYVNLSATNYNFTTQLKAGITAILRQGAEDTVGYVEEVTSLSSLIVRTTPALMQEVEEFINTNVELMVKQVELEIKIIQFTATEDSEFGVDLDLAYEQAGNAVSAITSGPTFQESTTSTGIASTISSGSFSGSSLFIRALKELGTVSVSTSQTIKATNHQMQEIDISETEAYLSEISVTTDDDDDSETVDITKSYARDGVKMLVIPTIDKGAVQLKMTGTISKVISYDTDEISDITIKSPKTRQALINISGRYEYNKPIIVTRMRQQTAESEKSSYADVTTGTVGSRAVVDTLVIVTPRRILETQ